MSELVFFSGTMDSGKSTLALQLNYTRTSRGRRGLLFTRHDRLGESVISSRLGLKHRATEITNKVDILKIFIKEHKKCPINYLICDEAQFYSSEHIEQLAFIVDNYDIDVYAFGITVDFRTKLFEGSARLLELADRIEPLPVVALCWCGKKATHNARTVNGKMILKGEQVIVGDVEKDLHNSDKVEYETICRKHHMQKKTSLYH